MNEQFPKKTSPENRKVAIPVFHNRVAPRFDSGCGTIRIVEIGDNCAHNPEDVTLLDANPIDKMHHLAKAGVTTLICGGLTETCLRELEFLEIEVYPWISGDINEVVKLFAFGKLPKHGPKKVITNHTGSHNNEQRNNY